MMRAAHTGRPLLPLRPFNTPDRIASVLAQATATMNAEKQLHARGEMARLMEAYGLGAE